jgi:hypothetical protein
VCVFVEEEAFYLFIDSVEKVMELKDWKEKAKRFTNGSSLECEFCL